MVARNCGTGRNIKFSVLNPYIMNDIYSSSNLANTILILLAKWCYIVVDGSDLIVGDKIIYQNEYLKLVCANIHPMLMLEEFILYLTHHTIYL